MTRPFLLSLENTVKGAFLGGAWGILLVAIIDEWVTPASFGLTASTQQSVSLAVDYVGGATVGIVIGAVISLVQTRRALLRANQNAPPPAVPHERQP